MIFNLKDVLDDVSVFAGVNPGYDGASFAITEPRDAAALVYEKMRPFGIAAKVFPGVVLYPRERGCPAGGEVVGAVFTSPQTPDLMTIFNSLKQQLEQVTISVITPQQSGVLMRGFVVDFGANNMKELAGKWQALAAEKQAQTGFHVSAALYEAEGHVYCQAEANPTRINDLTAWEKSALEIVHRISETAQPVFRTVGYYYLKTPSI